MACIACVNLVKWYLSYVGSQKSVKGVRHGTTSLEDALDITKVIDGSHSSDDDINTDTEE